jgi:hypothetical protein
VRKVIERQQMVDPKEEDDCISLADDGSGVGTGVLRAESRVVSRKASWSTRSRS